MTILALTQLTYRVDFELPEGSSGTWVVSEEVVMDTNDAGENVVSRMVCVHGVIVADDCYGDVYMIPLANILDDMKQVLNASSVSLPQDSAAIARLIQWQSFRLPHSAEAAGQQQVHAAEDQSRASTAFTKAAEVRTSSTSQFQPATDQNKETVWVCCQCGDAGMSTWQTNCHTCGHSRCSFNCIVDYC
jgi:ABC-type ATPase with predicted acetyltransferase domain